jgi:protein SCO1/2
MPATGSAHLRVSSILWAAALVIPAVVSADADPHAAHRMQSANVSVSDASYEVPDVELRDASGRNVRLRELLAEDRPVALNFIFTSCTSVCPVMTASFLQMQRTMRAENIPAPGFVSISIDPEFDTAPVLSAYARRYDANWTFLTGTETDVTRVLRAFDAYRGGKVNHVAVTLLRAPHDKAWTRIEGLVPSGHLVQVWKSLAGSG